MTFQEKQKFGGLIEGFGVVAGFTSIIYSFLPKEYLNDIPFFAILAIVLGLSLLISFFFIQRIKLSTTINKEEITLRHMPYNKISLPFSTKKINWKEIKDVNIVNYNFKGVLGVFPIVNYNFNSFLGIFPNIKRGKVYKTSSDTALALTLKDGKSVIIGTQKKEELKQFLKTHINIS